MKDPMWTCRGCGEAVNGQLFVGVDYLSGDTFPVVRCEACGLAQTVAQSETASASYTGYYGRRQGVFEAMTNWLRVRCVVRALRGRPSGDILDVGCGRGGFLAMMRDRGWRVMGVEREGSGYEAAWRERGLGIRSGTWTTTAFRSEEFDFVTFWHVFEHLEDPHAALDQLWRVLRTNGSVLIAVPNFGGTQAAVFGRRWFHLDVPRHLFHFSQETLENLLRAHGFHIQAVSQFSFEYDVFGFVQSALNTCCRTQNMLFDILMGRRPAWAIAEGGPLRERLDLLMTAVLALPLSILAPAVCVVTSLVGRGGTLEVYATKPAPTEADRAR